MYNLKTILIPKEYEKFSTIDRYNQRIAYLIDVTNVSEDEKIFIPSGSVCVITGTISKNIRLTSLSSLYLFDNLKLNNGSINIEYAAADVMLKNIENLDSKNLSTLNIRTKGLTILENEKNCSCTINLKFKNDTLSRFLESTFNLEEQKNNSPRRRLVMVLAKIRDMNLDKISEELKEEQRISLALKLNRRIDKVGN